MEERHKIILGKQNPHWQGTFQEVPSFQRNLFPIIQKYLSVKQAIAIIGLRRVGKTVLLQQVLQSIQAEAKNLCYISFDDWDFQDYELAYELVQYFLQNTENGRRYLFLDEIQKVPQWPDLIKTLYDSEMDLKIIISGSSSLELKQSKESLAGRLLTFHVPVLQFPEFVRYHALPATISLTNIQREYDLLLPRKNKYEELFQQYVLQGAFPELLGNTDEEYMKKYIVEVTDKIIIDISRNIDASKEKEIHDLILLFCKSTGRVFEIHNLAALLKIDRNLVSKLLQALQKTFLLKISFNYTPSISKRLRTSKKCYLAHSCIPIALLQYPFDVFSIEGSERGHLVETAIASNMKETMFWKQLQSEVDFILPNKTPVEVKFQSTIQKHDAKAVLQFLEKYKCPQGIIVTKGFFDVSTYESKKLFYLPAWCFLLLENLQA